MAEINERLNSAVEKLFESSYARQRATAWLMVGLINHHFPHPDVPDPDADEVLGTAGCVRNCGPCHALKWFSDNARVQFEDYVRLTAFQAGGWAFWDSQANRLRWDWFEAYWAGHKGCWTNGTEVGCYGEDDDPAVPAVEAPEASRAHVDLCTETLCTDFDDDCQCWCHAEETTGAGA